MEPEDVVQMYFDGTYDGERRPSSEWRFHRDILAARPDIDCVLHCHSIYATTLAVPPQDDPELPLHDRRRSAARRSAAPATPPSAPRRCPTPRSRRSKAGTACLLGQHGQIALGKTLGQALAIAIEVETLSRLYVQALTLGEPPILDDEEMERVIQQMRNMSYGQAPDLDGVNDIARKRA